MQPLLLEPSQSLHTRKAQKDCINTHHPHLKQWSKKDHWILESWVPLELLDGIKKSHLFSKKCCFGKPPVTFCLFLNSYWKCKRNEVWNSKHVLFSILDVLLLPVKCNYPNMSELENTQKWRQPQKTQTGDWTWPPWWLIPSKTSSETAMAGHSTVLLLVIQCHWRFLFNCYTSFYPGRYLGNKPFQSFQLNLFYAKEHIL